MKTPRWGLGLYTTAFYLYLYLPIVVLIAFSFNTDRLNLFWEGFTWRWYAQLFGDGRVALATRNTLFVATTSTVVSTVIGTLAAMALQRYAFRLKKVSEPILYIPIVIPEVVMGIGLLSLYSTLKMNLGLLTITLSHIAFSIPFVALVVRARLHGFDRSLEEAAMDLGSTEFAAFRRVTLPYLAPAIAAAAMLAFTVSIDDYVITSLVAGIDSQTLPMTIYAMARRGVSPELNAISTIVVVALGGFVLLSERLRTR